MIENPYLFMYNAVKSLMKMSTLRNIIERTWLVEMFIGLMGKLLRRVTHHYRETALRSIKGMSLT